MLPRLDADAFSTLKSVASSVGKAIYIRPLALGLSLLFQSLVIVLFISVCSLVWEVGLAPFPSGMAW